MKTSEPLLKKLLRRASGSMKKYEMLDDGDKVMIGLSGGKDSLALVEIMAARKLIFKPKFEVMACHVGVENIPYKSDIEYLKDFCVSRGVEFVHITTSFSEDTKQGRTPCFLCSWSRRKKLFDTAQKYGCNKLALGHHQDDILETLLLNQIFQGSYATMPPVLKMQKFDMTVIRPLAEIREAEIAELAVSHNYRKQIKNCPYETDSNRRAVRDLLRQMERLNPDAAGSLWSAMSNIKPEYLP